MYEVYSFGFNQNGQCGLMSKQDQPQPRRIQFKPFSLMIKSIHPGGNHAWVTAYDKNNKESPVVWFGFGLNTDSQLSGSFPLVVHTPEIADLEKWGLGKISTEGAQIIPGYNFTIIRTRNDKLYGFGFNTFG